MSHATSENSRPDGFVSLYPVVAVDAPAPTAAEFERFFALKPVFETDWYIHLKSQDGNKQIGLIRSDHDSIPGDHRGNVNGTLVTIETDDAEALWARVQNELSILHPLVDEAWGQRHFIAELVGGVVVDVVQLLPQD